MAHGAKILDCSLFYPDQEKWAILDPDGKYKEVTNRYASERAELTEGETSFDLISTLYIKLNLNPVSIKALGIRYLITTVDPTHMLAKYDITCTYVNGQDDYGIYRLKY